LCIGSGLFDGGVFMEMCSSCSTLFYAIFSSAFARFVKKVDLFLREAEFQLLRLQTAGF
jgi:hypothetical protein